MQKRMESGEDPGEIQSDFETKAAATIQKIGISPAQYSQFSQLMQTDPRFAARVQQAMTENEGTAKAKQDTESKKGSGPYEK